MRFAVYLAILWGIFVSCTVASTTVSTTATHSICGASHLNATSSGQYLQSPGYPTLAYPYDDCTWTITAANPNKMVRILILDANFLPSIKYTIFDMCTHSHVEIYDGLTGPPRIFCGEHFQRIFQSTGRVLTVWLSLNSADFSSRGFQLEYFETADKDPTSCGGIINLNTSVQVTSPLYPQPYYSYKKCIWTVHAPSDKNIQVFTKYFDVDALSPCPNDIMEIFDGVGPTPSDVGSLQTCTIFDERSVYISGGNNITITIQSSTYNSGTTFKFEIKAGHYQACSNGTVNIDVGMSNISSVNYPFKYPNNAVCTWKLDTGYDDDIVVIEATSFDLEDSSGCLKDYVEAFDGADDSADSLGRWCGGNMSTTKSTGRYMFIKFKSDGSGARNGFKIKCSWEFQYHSWLPDSQAGIIIGGIVGGIFVVQLVLSIAAHIKDRLNRGDKSNVTGLSIKTIS